MHTSGHCFSIAGYDVHLDLANDVFWPKSGFICNSKSEKLVMDEVGSKDNVVVLKTAFLTGAVADAVISIEWFLISLGMVDLPVHPSFFVGSGQDFKYVLSIGALFMMGWAFVLYWGSVQPIERRGILLITAAMLFIAILSDYLVFAHLFSMRQIVLGTTAKLFLVILFSGSYWHSKRIHG